LSENLYPKKVRIEKLFFYLMKLIKGQHESGFKIFPSRRQSRKKIGKKKRLLVAFLKKEMNPHKGSGGDEKKKKHRHSCSKENI